MKEIQDKIKKFNDERKWSDPKYIKDIMLNMSEEIGEMWSIIKWVDTQKQMELIKENKKEVENFIGDMIYLILKIAYICGVDSKKAIEDVLEELGGRFPKDLVRGNHGNTRAGGIDLKQSKNP
ncbi:MAG: hypothetical protein JSV92_03265 [archaeon]|nr:MAG: hypothetical protein JSV92_03265 [archaeon]